MKNEIDIKKELARISKLSIEIYNVANTMLEHAQRDKRHFAHIDEIGFSNPVNNNLRRREIYYAEQIAKMTRRDLIRLRGIGEKAVKEIVEKMREKGFDNKTW